ncbi:MAG: diacylglycerol kinase family lipid kinase [Rhodospirillales bacterium]|nr:diacylglycerol kinase family lipid kinase [Rhodospirillales bacterium]
MRTLFVVNPNSAGGKTGHDWPSMKATMAKTFPGHETALTSGSGDATNLTRRALKAGIERIIVVGGDGTINETVNGFFEDDQPLNPDALLGIISSGTGGDFRKTFKIGNTLEEALEVLRQGRTRLIDVGRLSLTGFDGESVVRYFDNITSFGMSGEIMVKVNNATIAKRLGGTFAFYWHTLFTLMKWRNTKVHLTVDDRFDQEIMMNTIHVANGEYSGAGMHFAPMAQPDDGFFDIIVLGDFKFHHLLTSSSMLYKGTHVGHPLVTVLKGRKVTARCEREMFVEMDGETPGKLPIVFENIPKAIKFIC